MEAIRIRRLKSKQYEIDVEGEAPWTSSASLAAGAKPRLPEVRRTTYRSNRPAEDNAVIILRYDWVKLPERLLVLDEQLVRQLNAWLYDAHKEGSIIPM